MATTTMTGSRQIGRSVWAVLAGFLVVVLLSLGVDEVLHLLGVYPPWNERMPDPGDNALALSYRCVIQVLGGWVMARLAPYAPMRHVWVGALIGLAFGTLGAVAMIPRNLGPAWYPILLAVSAIPTTWLGGRLYARRTQ